MVKRHDDVVMRLTAVAHHLETGVIRELRGTLHGYDQGGPDLMFRPANSSRRITIDVAVDNQTKP